MTTEEKILTSAKKVFIAKGYSGARMHEIADDAGINKALLHYYFRNKEILFEAIFNDAMKTFAPRIMSIFMSELSFEDKIRDFVNAYITILQNNPHIAIFIMHELYNNPYRIAEMLKEQGAKPEIILSKIKQEIKDNDKTYLKPEHIFVNIISMCIFPFAAKPIVQGIVFENDEKKYIDFIEERKEAVTYFILNSLKNS